MSASQHSERDEIARAVGHVAIEAAWLEYYAAILASTLIGSERADTFVMGQGWGATYNGLRALLDERIIEAGESRETLELDVPFYKATLKHIREADHLMTKRNNVVHALWSLPNDEGLRDAITYKRWGKRNVDDLVSLKDLQVLRQNLNFRMAAIAEAVGRIAGPDDSR
jgi:hypothetical protein